MAKAIYALHQAGLLHGELRPENILLVLAPSNKVAIITHRRPLSFKYIPRANFLYWFRILIRTKTIDQRFQSLEISPLVGGPPITVEGENGNAFVFSYGWDTMRCNGTQRGNRWPKTNGQQKKQSMPDQCRIALEVMFNSHTNFALGNVSSWPSLPTCSSAAMHRSSQGRGGGLEV